MLKIWIGIIIGLTVGSAARAIAAPQVLIDEDFTDGQFDDVGAGKQGQNWRRFGQGFGDFVSVQPTRDRAVPMALVRQPELLGHRWSGYQWWLATEAEAASPRQDFCIHPTDEVVIVQFTAFSDISGQRRLDYGVEIALLDHQPQFAAPPHYGHDLSFEAQQVFNTKSGLDQVQLFANVENQETHSPATRYAHVEGAFDRPELLEALYPNLVIWRNRAGQGSTNIEQWGLNRSGDYEVAHELRGSAPDRGSATCIPFNTVQLTLFAPPLANLDNLLRPGIQPSELQVGITQLQVGITSRSDFNLDYRVDEADIDIIWAHWQQAGATLRMGDASNDGIVNELDLAIALRDHIRQLAWF